jgi:CBS domain-containing protein
MTARTLMNDRPLTLRRTDRLQDAARLILDHHYRNVPVVDEAGRYLGAVSANRLLGVLLPRVATMEDGLSSLPFVKDTLEDLRERWKDARDLAVTDFLDPDVATIDPDMPIAETLLTLYHNRTSLPVVERDTGRLVGIVSHWAVGKAVVGAGDP